MLAVFSIFDGALNQIHDLTVQAAAFVAGQVVKLSRQRLGDSEDEVSASDSASAAALWGRRGNASRHLRRQSSELPPIADAVRKLTVIRRIRAAANEGGDVVNARIRRHNSQSAYPATTISASVYFKNLRTREDCPSFDAHEPPRSSRSTSLAAMRHPPFVALSFVPWSFPDAIQRRTVSLLTFRRAAASRTVKLSSDIVTSDTLNVAHESAGIRR